VEEVLRELRDLEMLVHEMRPPCGTSGPGELRAISEDEDRVGRMIIRIRVMECHLRAMGIEMRDAEGRLGRLG
jgi:hypothetical protein